MEKLKAEVIRAEEYEASLSRLLKATVNEGAAIGFLPPMGTEEAASYWRALPSGQNVILFAVMADGEAAGSVQLHLADKQNGLHRAEIAKLMTHPQHRRKGIGRLLMNKAEERAREEGRSLLVLDTREGDPSNRLYQSLGYKEAGRIPNYAKSADGTLHATVIYYKEL
ncbi:GNAT family N-acetyltransferase [Bacillus mangrovi]|uniref:GNAT family N-acetyltransferase n=1 Tax=Metabacillus mangrovi TaxID=1491830 RepID=A0A7X2V4A3_9BACI|nr:GNAT family N-acetyltransferase [Metabacillus mangrovi]MTH52906.1 GNAT family N-acetyltransferase [Metabacillus mangrovi]